LLLKDTISALRKWNNWKVKNNIKGNPPNLESELWEYEALKAKKKNLGPCYFYDELDVTLRHKAFQLAIHYWEGRWLEATKEMLDNDTEKGKGRSAIEAKWKRRAMLTPCFVSTFYMAPKFFTYY